MRKAFVLMLTVVAAFCLSPWQANAGKNLGGTAHLSWAMGERVADLEAVPESGEVTLYVQLGGVSDVAGCEFEMTWLSMDGSYELIDRDYPVDNGGCNWIMKLGPGEQLLAPLDEVDGDMWKAAFAGPRPSGCTSGNVAVAKFKVGDVPGRFCLSYLKVSDVYGQVDVLPVTGGATVLGGQGVEDICPDPAPLLKTVTPSTAYDDGVHELAFWGLGFKDGCEVKLQKGALWILPAEIESVDYDLVKATFDLSGAESGKWSVVLTNSDGQSAVLVEALSIRNPPPPAPVVTAVEPPFAFEGEEGRVVVTGRNFYGTPTVVLQTRNGYAVEAEKVELRDGALVCSFDFADQPLGDYTLIVANPDGQYYRLIGSPFSVKKTPLAPNAFRVGALDDGFVIRWKIQNTEDFRSVTLYRSSPGEAPVALASMTVGSGRWCSFTDRQVKPGVKYDYKLLINGVDVPDQWSEAKTAMFVKSLPARTELLQNTPNPFNPITTIRFSLERRQHVQLRVFDLTGRLVRTLLDGNFSAGLKSVTWDGTDDLGRAVASGLYFYRLEAEDGVFVRKMIMLK